MTVVFYSFSKRINSTARPSGGVSVNCNLKSPCSTTHPTIELQFTGGTEPSAWNMCFISEFGRYYYISEWVYNETVWTAHCDVDALASWKDDIAAQSCYILRSASEWNGNIRDDSYPIIGSETSKQAVNFGTGWNGFFVIGVAASVGIAPVSFYALTPTMMTQLLNDLWLNITAITGLTNPLEYFYSLRWFPFTCPFGDADLTTFKIGLLSRDFQGYLVDAISSTVQLSNYVDVSTHPQNGRGRFLEREPYTLRRFSWYPFGVFKIVLPSFLLENSQHYLDFNITVDLITGEAVLKISKRAGGVSALTDIQIVNGTIGVPIPISSGGSDLREVAQIAVATASAVAGNITASAIAVNKELDIAATLKTSKAQLSHIAAAEQEKSRIKFENISEVGTGIVSALNGISEYSSVSGGQGSFLMMGASLQPTLYSDFFLIADDNTEEIGRPLCKTKTISSLSGYIKCSNSDISISATTEELSTIKSALDSGFFYE